LPYSIKRTLLADNATVSVEGPSSSPSNNRLIPIASTVSTESNATSLVGGNATSGLNCAPEKKISPVNATSTGANVDVAVLDTGISLSHPDLNVYRHVSFIDGVTSGDDDVGHGSHIAGIIGAKDNSIGVVGIVPDARLWSIKVCDSAVNIFST
jgi:subtilisin family serine protease